jgi:hypothetical protein
MKEVLSLITSEEANSQRVSAEVYFATPAATNALVDFDFPSENEIAPWVIVD